MKDGWSYLVPNDDVVLESEVSIGFSDEPLDEHVREQKEALKSLYLSSLDSHQFHAHKGLTVSEEGNDTRNVHFIVKRGMQVMGVATYCEATGHLFDVAVRPSAQKDVAETLLEAGIDHAKKEGRPGGSLTVKARNTSGTQLFQQMGFRQCGDASDTDVVEMELKH